MQKGAGKKLHRKQNHNDIKRYTVTDITILHAGYPWLTDDKLLDNVSVNLNLILAFKQNSI